MQFVCNRAVLTEAVTNISRVIPSKSTNYALEGIHIKANNDTLQLVGYNNESGLTTTIDAIVKTAGEIVLPAHLFCDILRKMDGEDVSVSVGDKLQTIIVCGFAEFTVLGIPPEDFPELPTISDGTALEFEQGVFKSMINQTSFAIATNDDKPVHTGSLFDIENGQFNLVSVDGFRLAIRSAGIGTTDKYHFIVPGKVLKEIEKLLSDKETEVMSFLFTDKHIIFKIGNYEMVTRLLEGDFIDYKKSIPTDGNIKVRVNTRNFKESIERVSLLISDRIRSPLFVEFSSDNIKISCTSNVGKSFDEVSCQLEGNAVNVGFNHKFLYDALNNADTDEIIMLIAGPLFPVKIIPPDGDHFLFLVLPVRMKNE